MAILAGDIKLVASQVMDDINSGGGAPTANVVADGVSNSLFKDISELDRASGRVNLRKVFAAVQTDNVDTYLGGNIIVADPPDDPRVSVTIFSTDAIFDRRTDARDRIEAYLHKGSSWPGYLLENHITGQRAIQLFQREGTQAPAIGETLYLVANEDSPSEYSQYVRVTDVSSEVRTYTHNTGNSIIDYTALVVTCDLSDALRYDFPGSQPSRLFAMEAGKTRVRETLVADAAKYYGVVKVTEEITTGALAAEVESVFTQLVPSAQTETPLVDMTAGGTSQAMLDGTQAGAPGIVTYTTGAALTASTVLSLGNAVYPGTLSIAGSGFTLTDNGGALMDGATVVGTIDYDHGQVTLASAVPSYTGSKTITYRPGAVPLRVADTAGVHVDIESRSYNYTMTITPCPAPATLIVSFRAQGEWYELRDNGAGVLRGLQPEYGVGTISYSTGTASVTLGALPDVDSEIIFAWGGRPSYINRGATSIAAPKVVMQLAHEGVTPSSLSIAWNDGSARTATDNGQGSIAGDATGKINYRTGLIELTPGVLPGGAQSYTVTYTYGPPEEEEFHAPARNVDESLDIEVALNDLIPGSVEVVWNLLVETYEYISTTPAEMQLVQPIDPWKTVRDDGLGALRDLQGTSFGTVNYTTGVIHLLPDTTVGIPVARYNVVRLGTTRNASGQRVPVYRNLFSHWEYVTAGAAFPVDGDITVRYRSTGTSSAGNENFNSSAGLTIDLTPNNAEIIVPGSINFALASKTYFDRAGLLYSDLDILTGAATAAGSINYTTGAVTITEWIPGTANTVTLRSLLTTLDGAPVDEVSFRVPSAPVRPSSLQVLATKLTGGTINVTADNAGAITASGVEGKIDYDTGVVRVRFGAWVPAAGNESEIWYDADAVVAGLIFKPAPVFAHTIKYNAVAYSYLPLDADIIGLDPVRLPQDGRVPIFRPGDFGVLGHAATIGPQTVSNAQVINCGRVRLSRVRVIGNNGVVITTGYTADLEAGTVTFTDVSGYSQPVTIEHRIEDMAQISDVQISGRLTFTRQISHDYPANTSYLSSALVAGDLRAYVDALFDQASWAGTWADAVSGGAATATFNDVLTPITVTNSGAVTERWAVVFTSTTAFNVMGEHVGVIATGNTSTECAPLNPATGNPYFTIPALGWGSGWSVGNVLRFNTTGSIHPVWVVRTIQQGQETVSNDSFTLLIRGDVDTP